MSTTSRTFNSIDIAKLVASLLVVAIHTGPVTGLGYTLLIDWLARMAVPFFFVVSAFFFFGKGVGTRKLLHYERRMALLYIFWLVVELPMVVERSFTQHPGDIGWDMAIFMRNLVLNSTFRGSWFIMALMIGVAAVFYLSRYLRTWVILLLGLVVYIPITTCTNYYYYFPQQVQQAIDWHLQVFGWLHNSFLPAFIFIALGKLIANHQREIMAWRKLEVNLALVACLAASAIEVLSHDHYFSDLYFLLVPTSAVWLVWILHHESTWHLDYKLLRNLSTIIYFSHFIFDYLLRHCTTLRHLPLYLAVLALSVALCLVMRALSRCKPLAWLRYAY